jgi:hypothetical protein
MVLTGIVSKSSRAGGAARRGSEATSSEIRRSASSAVTEVLFPSVLSPTPHRAPLMRIDAWLMG